MSYTDASGRVWRVEEVARLEAEGPSIDAPRVQLLLRFESEGEERFAGCPPFDWRASSNLERLFLKAVPTP